MATPITVADVLVEMDQMISVACQETGVNKDEFLLALVNAMLYRPRTSNA